MTQVTELKMTDVFMFTNYLRPKGEACWAGCISSGWDVWVLSAVVRVAEGERNFQFLWNSEGLTLVINISSPGASTLLLLTLPGLALLWQMLYSSPAVAILLNPCGNFESWEGMTNPQIQV